MMSTIGQNGVMICLFFRCPVVFRRRFWGTGPVERWCPVGNTNLRCDALFELTKTTRIVVAFLVLKSDDAPPYISIPQVGNEFDLLVPRLSRILFSGKLVSVLEGGKLRAYLSMRWSATC